MKSCGDCEASRALNGSTTACRTPQRASSESLSRSVAMRAGRQLRLVVEGSGEVVARVGLEGQHAAGHAAVLRLVVQQRQHGLVAPVHAVEIADRQRAGGGNSGMAKTAKDLHGALSF